MIYAFDIETTGLTANDAVTVVGVTDGDEYHVYYDASTSRVEQDIEWPHGSVVLHPQDDEKAVLTSLSSVYAECELHTEGNLLAGFNSSNFDFPMLRTRYVIQNLAWGLEGVSSLDLKKTYQYEFQTKDTDVAGFNKKPLRQFGEAIGAPVDSEMYKSELVEAVKNTGFTHDQLAQFASAQGDDAPTSTKQTLDSVHELLVREPVDDPFEKSEEAVQAFLDGNVEDVIRHNLSDLKKTIDLVELVENYVPHQELRLTKL